MPPTRRLHRTLRTIDVRLNKAIQTVAKFAARGTKAPELYKSVLLIPAVGELPARVFATDGMLSCVVRVSDVDLPVALVPTDALAPIARHKIAAVSVDAGEVSFRAETGGVFKAKTRDLTAFPRPPDYPAMQAVDHWNHIWPLTHAAAGDKATTPTFKNIRLRPHVVEATDSIRVAVANVPGWPEDRLVPVKLLRGWKNGRVNAALTNELVWFEFGDEARYAPIRVDGPFPDCLSLMPEKHDWPAMVLETARLRETVEKAVCISSLKTVALVFAGSDLTVKAWSADEGGKGYELVLLGVASQAGYAATKILNGKFLVQALKAIRTPNVRLCYQDQADGPLRIESGAMAEGLWPWRA